MEWNIIGGKNWGDIQWRKKKNLNDQWENEINNERGPKEKPWQVFDKIQHGYEDEVLKTNQVENLETWKIDHSKIEDQQTKKTLQICLH